MNIKNTTTRIAAIALLAGLVAACASAPKELVEARKTFDNAKADPMVAQFAPVELRQAKKALDRAETEFDDEGDDQSTRAYSYIADRQARLAMIAAQNNKFVKMETEKKDELLAATDSARESATNAYERERVAAIMSAEQLKAEQAKLMMAAKALSDQEAALEKARNSGKMNAEQLAKMESELATQRATLDTTKQQLAAAEAATAALKAQLDEAQAKLKEFANVKQDKDRMIITLNGSVLFKVGQSSLIAIAQQRLAEVASVLQKQKGKKIIVAGHTDSQGKPDMNMNLSQARADSVRNYLVSQGVPAENISAKGFGETQPVADNSSPEGRANNRRVEIIVESASATTTAAR